MCISEYNMAPYLESYRSESYKGLCNNYLEGGRGGLAEKLEEGALHKIAAKIEGAQSKISHLTEGGLKFYSKCK